MNYRLAQIRIMAKAIREYKDLPIRHAVHEAVVAYELYKEAEIEINLRGIEKELEEIECNLS